VRRQRNRTRWSRPKPEQNASDVLLSSYTGFVLMRGGYTPIRRIRIGRADDRGTAGLEWRSNQRGVG